MHQEPALTYLVADGARARLIKRHGDGRFTTIATFHHEAGRHSRHAIEESDVDPARPRFAAELADAVEGLVADGELERLVLVAPPGLLADVSAALSGPAARAVVGQAAKDLTKLPERELHEALDGLVLRATS